MFTPLIFSPLYRQYLWGGRSFQSLLGRELEQPGPYAESWEIVDRETIKVSSATGLSQEELLAS